MNFNQGIYSLEEKKKLQSWLVAASLNRYGDTSILMAIDRLQREIDYLTRHGVVEKKSKGDPMPKFDWDKFGETVQWCVENKFHLDDENLDYGDFSEYEKDPKFNKAKLEELLNFFSDAVHTKDIDILNKEFYNDQIDEWAYTQRENKYFFPCERFIFISKAPGDTVVTFFDYYEISGQGTAFCLDIHRADDTEYVDERMKEYFIKWYDDFEEKLIEC